MKKSNQCNLCSHETQPLFTKRVLSKYEVQYYLCKKCEYVQTENPYWLKEAYTSAINLEDTGLVSRNIGLSKITTILIAWYWNKSGKYLDYSGGYGLFTRLMRDVGINYFWSDPYCENILAKGFEKKSSDKKFELVTLFEVCEHMTNPQKELGAVMQLADNILFSTELIPNLAKLKEWDYLGSRHGQHVSFYSEKALKIIAKENNFNCYSDGRMIHLFTKRKIHKIIFITLVKLRELLYPLFSTFFTSKTYQDHLLLRKP